MISPNRSESEDHSCKEHPDQPASARCKTCGAPLCYDCKYLYYGDCYCGQCYDSLRHEETKGDRIYPAAAKTVAVIAVIMGLLTALGLAGVPRLRTDGPDSVVLSILGLLLWHAADVVLFICGIGAATFRKWARKGLIFGGTLSILRGAAWPAVFYLTGNAPPVLLLVFHSFVALYGLSVVLFYSSRKLYDEFRAVRP